VPAAVIFGLSFLGIFAVAIGRPFEPARYVNGRVQFRNSRYQQLFDELNRPPNTTAEPGISRGL
jgi:hypothetical protein